MNDNIGKNIKTMSKALFWVGLITLCIAILFITVIGIRVITESKFDKNIWSITNQTIKFLDKKEVIKTNFDKQNKKSFITFYNRYIFVCYIFYSVVCKYTSYVRIWSTR